MRRAVTHVSHVPDRRRELARTARALDVDGISDPQAGVDAVQVDEDARRVVLHEQQPPRRIEVGDDATQVDRRTEQRVAVAFVAQVGCPRERAHCQRRWCGDVACRAAGSKQGGRAVHQQLGSVVAARVCRMAERHAGQRHLLPQQRRGIRERPLPHPRDDAAAVALDDEAEAGVLHARVADDAGHADTVAVASAADDFREGDVGRRLGVLADLLHHLFEHDGRTPIEVRGASGHLETAALVHADAALCRIGKRRRRAVRDDVQAPALVDVADACFEVDAGRPDGIGGVMNSARPRAWSACLRFPGPHTLRPARRAPRGYTAGGRRGPGIEAMPGIFGRARPSFSRNYGDVFLRPSRGRLSRRPASLARRRWRSRQVKVHSNGVAVAS